MCEDAWEDAIEQLLDEDAFFNQQRYRQAPTSKTQAHTRALVKALRHWLEFLREQSVGRSVTDVDASRPSQLKELENRLPVLGLVAVDASLITVDEFLLALRRIRGMRGALDSNLRDAACVALILGFRLGLRRKEAAGLRLSDIDSIDYVHVRANRFRTLKTSNAKRDLPMRLLVPDKELSYVRRRLRARSALVEAVLGPQPTEPQRTKPQRTKPQQTKEDAPPEPWLFSQSDDPRKTMDFDAVIAEIHAAFRGDPLRGWEPIDPTFHYHRLRHSFLNLTLLRMWPPLWRISEHLFGVRHPETLKWIRDKGFRRELFGSEAVTEADLQGLALLLGHGSATTSLEHYCHVLDLWEDPPTWTEEQHAQPVVSRASGGQGGLR